MEVTRSNFREILPEIEDDISTAHFLAIDGEFTGLHEGENVNAFDSPSEYYGKLRSGGMNFMLIQLGLCAFKYNRETEKFTYKAYTFYVFPQSFNHLTNDSRFLCQSSSLNFLASHDFDFNKLFKEGIPYLREAEEKKLREQLEEKQKSRSNSSSRTNDSSVAVPVPEEHVATLDNVCSQIEDFLSKEEDEELVLEGYNAFVRKLIYQTVAERFDNETVSIETRVVENNFRVLVVSRALTDQEKQKKDEEKQIQERKDLDSAVGISLVIRMISQSGKLIIGHNMLLDLCHIIHQFCVPLPESYMEFKELITFMFPRIIDTKYMSSNVPFKSLVTSTVLGHLHKTLSEEPFSLVCPEPEENDRGYKPSEKKPHEAGYDAYLTGVCFLTLANYLGTLEEPRKYPVLPNSPLLKPYINKLHLMRVQDVAFIDLMGEDVEPSRDHVFHVTFPKEWKTYDLMQLFSPFGSVLIAWLTDTSAYVGLHRRDQAHVVSKTLTQNDTYTVQTYKDHKRKQLKRMCHCQHLSQSSSVPSSSATYPKSRDPKKRVYQVDISETDESTSQSTAHNENCLIENSESECTDQKIESISEKVENENEDEGTFKKVKRKKRKQGATTKFLNAAGISTGRGKRKKLFDESDRWD